MRSITFVLALLLGSFPALAQQPQEATGPYKTSNLLEGCRAFAQSKPSDSKLVLEAGVCMGAVSTVMRLGPMMSDKFRFCPNPQGTIQQAMPVLLKFIEENPTMLKYDIRDVANFAFRQFHRCE